MGRIMHGGRILVMQQPRRQHMRGNHISIMHHNDIAYDILQLPDIAGPAIG